MKKPLGPFLGYLAFFYLAWTFGWVYGLYPWAQRMIGPTTLSYALINIGCRLLIWVLPACLYLRYIDHVNVVDYLQLRRHWRRGLIVGLMLSVLNVVGTVARHGPSDWSRVDVTWNNILGTSILVGVFEEIPFRGFMLQKLQERLSFEVSTAVSSLLFVGAHVPGWILLGSLTAHNVIFVFVFGTIMAIVLRYSGSLWASIVSHSLNDGLSHVVYHV
jgi:membrane protease YdiL (CAAX protease family)